MGEASSLSDREPQHKSFLEGLEDTPHCNFIRFEVSESTSKRKVLILSTMQSILEVTKDDGKKKLAIIELYNFTKEGTDVVDQKMGNYSVKTESSK